MISFLDGARPGGNSFCLPGALQKTRWAAIYVFKMYLFHEQYLLSSDQMFGIKDLCIFIDNVNIHIQAWFNTLIREVALRQYLEFLQKFHEYKNIYET